MHVLNKDVGDRRGYAVPAQLTAVMGVLAAVRRRVGALTLDFQKHAGRRSQPGDFHYNVMVAVP